MSNLLNKIVHGDCLVVLKELADNSVDCCVTDPPYGWKFMGKKWDYEIPSVDIWKEVLRVLKPGAHILVACGTRTQHRMAVNIEDAGFEIRDVICWHYGQGFPKNLDISKAIDSRGGQNISWFGKFLRHYRTLRGMSQRDLCERGKWYDKVNHGGAVTNWELGYNLPTVDQYNKLIQILDLPAKNLEAAEREVIGKYSGDMGGLGGQRLGISGGDITLAKSSESIKWCGWGTALKPATEFWTLARKPISEKNIAANVIEHGTGGLNIDACRIESPDIEAGKEYTVKRLKPGATLEKSGGNWRPEEDDAKTFTGISKNGRFPANVILDDFMAQEMDIQSGELTSGKPSGKRNAGNKNVFGACSTGGDLNGYGDTGGASRFFKVVSWSEEDRELERFYYCAKPSSKERGDTSHPTVKPQTLIQYLIKLICPIEPGRVMLEPYAGSGSHCLAAHKLGIDFMGMEMDEKNYNEANERLKKELGLFNT